MQPINPYRIRLMNLGKTYQDLVAPLMDVHGIHADTAEISNAVTGKRTYPKMLRIKEGVDEIITEWERIAKKKGGNKNAMQNLWIYPRVQHGSKCEPAAGCHAGKECTGKQHLFGQAFRKGF